MTEAPERWRLEQLLSLFELEWTAPDTFLGPNPARGRWDRVFGGQMAAQSVRAAQLTVPEDRAIHSMHGYFLRPGRVGEPIEFRVERPRDSRSFTSRHVVAVQQGEVAFEMLTSFHDREPGPTYQMPIAPDAGDPEEVPAETVPAGRMRSMMPFELRSVGPQPPEAAGYRSTRRVWMRTAGRLPDDPALHACVLAFASDMGVVSAVRAAIEADANPRTGRDRFRAASLDHAVWFHRPIRADEWVFTDLRAVTNHGARGLATGTMHTADGVLGLSIAQEALIRPMGG